MAIFALSFFLVYDFGRFLSHQRAIEILNSRLYRDGPPTRVAAFPTGAVSPFEWQGWVERPEFVMRFQVNVLQQFDPTSGAIVYKPAPSAAMDAARQTHPFRVFLPFAQYQLWSVTAADNPDGAHNVTVTDWRFPFGATALVDSSNRVISSSFHYEQPLPYGRGSVPSRARRKRKQETLTEALARQCPTSDPAVCGCPLPVAAVWRRRRRD